MVRHKIRLLAVAVCLVGIVCSEHVIPQDSARDPGKETNKDRIDALVRQLGHDEFAKRQAASKELEAIGEPALEALRKAAKSSESAESRRRAEQLLQVIEPKPLRLASTYFSPGLPLGESQHPVYLIDIVGRTNAKGQGKGKINLIVTPPNYDEYGDIVTGTEVDLVARPQKIQRSPIVLDCTIELVKTGFVGRVNTPSINRSVFRIKGPKITTTLLVATQGPGLTSGRLLVLGKDERVEHVVELTDLTPRPGGGGGNLIPCHPGCFPAGTLVYVPAGTRPIERIREGDLVTSIDAEGKPTSAKVIGVFVTRNRVLEVQVKGGKLVTTETQPVALEAGGFRPAGELKPGDHVWRWLGTRRQPATVLAVSATDREAEVFNLVLGDARAFIAGDFLVRSKPPSVVPQR